MPAFDYDCPTIINAFIAETGRYVNEVAMKAIPYTPWLANTPRGEWRDGMGAVQNSIVWERTVPTDTGDEWTETVTSDGTAPDACDFNPELVHFGQTTRSMRKHKRYLQTEDFCIEDLRDDFMIEQFLRGVGRNLSAVSSYVWATRRRREYARLSDHKVTEKDDIDLNATSFPVGDPPTSRLLNGTLEQIYDYLYLDGAFTDGAIGTSGSGRRVATLITDANTSRDLIRQDPSLREDFRYAFSGMGENSPLLTAYGQGHSYNGFKHVIDYTQRWDIVNGAWVERHPYKGETATTKGYKQDLDDLYRYAEYQDSYIHIPTVYRELVPRPMSNPGGKFQFSPQTYMGEFDFKVILDRKCNPRGNKGFFDALFMSASEPGQTWHGFVIRHKNCIPSREPRDCSQYEQYS